MPLYLGGQYEQRGGDEKLRQRYAQLTEWAREDGVLDQARKTSIPDRLKGAFARLTEFFAREEFAVAGAWDVIQGTADKGDTVGGRFIREFLGGTKLGNLIGVEDRREQEGFSEILEQRGVGEGGRLSDLIGENTVTKYFDPTVRGTAALGMAIMFTPSTWVTLGTGGAAKLVGRSGYIINATDKATNLVGTVYKQRLVRHASRLGFSDDAAKALEQGGDVWNKMENKVLAEMRDRGPYRGLLESGSGKVKSRLMEQSIEDVTRLAQAGMTGLSERSALRFGSTQFLGGNFRGIPMVDLATMGKPGQLLGAALRSNKVTRPLIEGADGIIGIVDQIFKRVPRGARKFAQFERMEANRQAFRQSGLEVANEILYGKRGFVPKALIKHQNSKFAKTLTLALDNPEEYLGSWIEDAARIGINREQAEAIVERWQDAAEMMGQGAVRAGLLNAEQFEHFNRRYIPHDIRGLDEDQLGSFITNSGSINTRFRGGDIGQYAKQRAHETFDDLETALAAQNLADKTEIVYNPLTLMSNYIERHVAGLADAEFAVDVVGALGRDPRKVLRNLAQDGMIAFKRNPTGDEIDVVSDLLSKKKYSPDDVKAFEGLSPEVRAHFLYERMSRVKSLHEFGEVLDTLKTGFDKIPNEVLARIRGVAKSGRYGAGQENFREYLFERGPNRGQRHIVPSAVADFLDREGSRFRLTPEAEKALRATDLLQNTFKLTHTAFFPAFHIRNAVSNVAAVSIETGLMAQLNPRRVTQAWKLLFTNDDFTIRAANGVSYTAAQLRGLMATLDISPQRLRIAELTGDVGTLLDKAKKFDRVSRGVGKVGTNIENSSRAIYFLNLVERGVSPQDAARKVKQVLFDYNDLSVVEKEILRRGFPFFTWTRKNAELQLRNILTKPGAVGAQIKVLNNGERGPEASYLPEYMRGEMKVKLEDRPGKKGTFISGIDLPINNIDVLWAGGVGKTMREQFSMFTPVIKAPLEYMLNLDTFSMQPIKGRRWMGQMGPLIEKTWPKSLQEWIELEKIKTADGAQYYKANGLKVYALTKNLLIGRLVNESVTALGMVDSFAEGDRKAGGAALLRVLSGMKFTEMDLTDAQRAKLAREVRALEAFLLTRGSVAEFSRTFRPESKKKQPLSGLFGQR